LNPSSRRTHRSLESIKGMALCDAG
jgi:hypothetical protein